MGTPVKWTPERVAEAVALIRRGLSVGEVADHFHISESALGDVFCSRGIRVRDLRDHKRGYSFRIWTKPEIVLLRGEHARGATDPQIAMLLKRTQMSVMGKRRQLGLKQNREEVAIVLPPVPLSREALRRCLGGCGALFKSEWSGNRICTRCRESETFRCAGIYYDTPSRASARRAGAA